MDLIKMSIKRPVTVLMVMLAVLILGGVSFSKMQMALSPDIEIPVALVITRYEDAGPEEVESLVTESIEGAVANVENVDSISSSSSEGVSMVLVEFNYGTDMDNAINSIRDKIGMIEGILPDDTSSPTIMKMDMNSMPVANIIISSESMDKDELKFFAEDTIQSRIERQPGIASVDVVGGSEKEIRIEIAPERLEGLGLRRNG